MQMKCPLALQSLNANIFCMVWQRGEKRAESVQKAIRWKIKSKRIQIASALVWVCVRAFIMSSHALYIRYKIQNIKKKTMSAFAFTLHIEKSTEICIIKEQMTRTGHGWMKNQHRHTHTHTNKVTNIHVHAHSRSQTKCRNAKPEVKLVNWLPCTFSYSTCNSVACMAYAVQCAVMEERARGCRRRIHLT